MSNNIFEELPSRKGGEAKPGADAAAGIEKKARQLVYDSRYEVKKMLAGKKADPATQERMVLQRIAKSTSIPAVKARARQMVSKKAAVAEDFIPMMEDSVATNIANAMFKVFVEGVEEVVPDYLEELNALGDKKYKIRVTDPKTGNSYVRYGTRDKITQLRAKGLKVEMTEYGEPREGERKRGEETARATGGGGRRRGGKKPKLDPVGKEDSDPDNDGKHNDPNDKYIMKRRAAIGAAIEKRKTVSASYEPEGEQLDENPLVGLGVRAGLAGLTALGGKMVYDRAKGVADKIKQQNDEKKKQIDQMLGNSYELEGEMLDEKKSRKKNDGNLANNYPPYDKVTRGDVIAGRLGKDEMGGVNKEDFLWSEGTDSTEGQGRKINPTKVDNYSSGVVKVSPEDSTQSGMKGPKAVYAHTELEGELIAEKAMSKAQQKFMGMVYARKKGKMKKGEASPEVEAAAKSMTKKEAKKFAKTKHKGLPEKVAEAADCGCDSNDTTKENEKDSRGNYAKVNMIKNKLRAMGAKNPIVMVASEGREMDEPGERDNNPDVRSHNRSLRDKKGRRMYPSGRAGYGRRPDISKDPRYGSVD